MKAYVLTTGSVFGLLALAHVWRVIEEGPHLATDPSYILITAVAAALCLWAWRLLSLTKGGNAKLSDREARSAIDEGRL